MGREGNRGKGRDRDEEEKEKGEEKVHTVEVLEVGIVGGVFDYWGWEWHMLRKENS